MPRVRYVGNRLLSLLNKVSSGYWQVMDPTNGFTALRAEVARELDFAAIDPGYFFESDLLFHLYLVRAVVVDVPMQAIYGDERSNLSVRRAMVPFLIKHLRNSSRRIRLCYLSGDFGLGGMELISGLVLLLFGVGFGGQAWIRGALSDTVQSSGTVMLAALPTLVGVQLLIAFLHQDAQNAPRERLPRVQPDVCPSAERFDASPPP